MVKLSSIESDILVGTASVQLSKSGLECLRAGLEDGADWSVIILAALEHGTAGLLCHHLLTAAADILPPEMHRAATKFLDNQRQTSAAAVAELFLILDVLGEAGISVIPFKGPVLAQAAYGNLAFRGFRDLDVLIREDDVSQTIMLLAAQGYRSKSEGLRERHLRAYQRATGQDILFAEGRMPVEPHWAFAERSLNAAFDTSGAFRRAVSFSLAGRVVQSLSPEDTLIVLGLHGSKERWKRLLWIADVSEFLRSRPLLDWDAALRRADESGLRRMVLLGVALADRVLGAPVPDPIRRIAEADQTCQSLAARVKLRMTGAARAERSFDVIAFRWLMHERLSARIRYVFRNMTQTSLDHFRFLDLPDRLAWAYPAVRVALRLANESARLKARFRSWR